MQHIPQPAREDQYGRPAPFVRTSSRYRGAIRGGGIHRPQRCAHVRSKRPPQKLQQQRPPVPANVNRRYTRDAHAVIRVPTSDTQPWPCGGAAATLQQQSPHLLVDATGCRVTHHSDPAHCSHGLMRRCRCVVVWIRRTTASASWCRHYIRTQREAVGGRAAAGGGRGSDGGRSIRIAAAAAAAHAPLYQAA
jgi:hypothetical protein